MMSATATSPSNHPRQRGDYLSVPVDADDDDEQLSSPSPRRRRRNPDEAPPASWISILILVAFVLSFVYQGIPIVFNLAKGKGFSLISAHTFWNRNKSHNKPFVRPDRNSTHGGAYGVVLSHRRKKNNAKNRNKIKKETVVSNQQQQQQQTHKDNVVVSTVNATEPPRRELHRTSYLERQVKSQASRF